MSFKKETEIFPALALGKGANIFIPSSLSLPTSFSPTSGWPQLGDKPSTGAARAAELSCQDLIFPSFQLGNARQGCRVTGGGEETALCLIIPPQPDGCSVILKVKRFGS